MKTTKNILFLLLVFALGFTSCKEDEKDEPIIPPVVVEQPTEVILVANTNTLASALSPSQLSTITSLRIIGNITDADFTTMRSNMQNLKVIDLSQVSSYNNNTVAIPASAFQGKTSLTSITFPPKSSPAITIGDYAFNGCTGLRDIYVNTTGVPSLGGTNVFTEVSTACTLHIKQDGSLTNDESWQIASFRDPLTWNWKGLAVVE